eukprot:1824646-Prymnesium_polylepis.1
MGRSPADSTTWRAATRGRSERSASVPRMKGGAVPEAPRVSGVSAVGRFQSTRGATPRTKALR